MTTALPIDQMIDTRRGTISRKMFVSPESHRTQLEKLFTRVAFVGHESQIPKSGDFFVSRMGDGPVFCFATPGERLQAMVGRKLRPYTASQSRQQPLTGPTARA